MTKSKEKIKKANQETSPDLSTEKIHKNIFKLAKAVESVQHGTWSIIWRNFLAGLMRALGIVFGYIIVIGLLLFIAEKLGLFDVLQNLWQNTSQQLDILKGASIGGSNHQQLPVDPEVLKYLVQ